MKCIATIAASLALSTAAQAADLVSYAGASPAPVWQGLYVGAMGGYAAGATNTAGSGPLAGGTIGLQGQWGQLVAGIEADGGWADIATSASALGGAITATARAADGGTVRGRVGVAFDDVLVYGTGGYAWINDQITVSVAVPPLVASISDNQFHNGWTVGGGVEVMFAPRWSVKAEYLYRSFESANYFSAVIPGGLPSGTLRANSGQVGINFHF